MWSRHLFFFAALLVVALVNAAEKTKNDLIWERQKRIVQMEDVIEETQKVLTDSMSGAGKALSDEKIKTLKQRLKVYRKERDQAKKELEELEDDEEL